MDQILDQIQLADVTSNVAQMMIFVFKTFTKQEILDYSKLKEFAEDNYIPFTTTPENFITMRNCSFNSTQ